MKDDRKFFSELEKNDPFFTMFETIRESDENVLYFFLRNAFTCLVKKSKEKSS